MSLENTNNNYKVTIFKTVRDVNNPHIISLDKIFDRIKTGKSSKQIIERILQETAVEEQQKIKKELPIICFSGEFSRKANDAVEKHSGVVVLDFDHLGDRLEEFRQKIISDRYTFACFLSPRRDGIKIVVKIPPVIQDHAAYCESLKLYYKDSALDDFKDISRGCFESYDPNIFINYDSKVFNIKVQPKVDIPFENKGIENKIADYNVIFSNIKKWVEKVQEYTDGNKYTFLVSIASACNRFGIPQEFVEKKLIEDYQNSENASFVKSEDFVDIVNRIYITYSNQFNISFFSQLGEMNDYDPTGPAKDVIYLGAIKQEMVDSFLSGDAKGETTYFKGIDAHWTWKKGEITLMHGIGNHGKSTLMLQLMLIKSVKEQTKWGIFSPEQNPPIDFYKDLIHTYIGKSTEKHHRNQMSMVEYTMGMDFIKEHFFFVYPKDESPTPNYINERFGELIVKHGIQGCMIDPFNQLDNDYGKNGRDDIYISSFLSKEKRFALKHNLYKIIVAHPKGSLSKITNGEFKGNYDCPDVYDLAGGAMWNNKSDNILAAYRPFYSTDKKNTIVEFRSQKIKKQKLVGIPGNVPLIFDTYTNRFLDNGGESGLIRGYSPFDTEYEQIKKEEEDRITAMIEIDREKKDNTAINDILKTQTDDNKSVVVENDTEPIYTSEHQQDEDF